MPFGGVPGSDLHPDDGVPRDPEAPAVPLYWDDAAFIAKIRTLARDRKMKLGALAERAGVSEAWLRHEAKNGRQVDKILRVAAALGCDYGELIQPAAGQAAAAAPAASGGVLDRLLVVSDLAAHAYVALSRRPDINPQEMLTQLLQFIDVDAAPPP